MKNIIPKRLTSKVVIVIITLFWTSIIFSFLFSIPDKLFNDPYSVVILDRDNQLLGAMIAEDGQWRFPEAKSLNEKYILCLTEFEDKRFFYHPGIDPLAMLRALKINLSNKKIKSGGSTISMQTIRLMRKNKNRTYFEKVVEIVLALRLEIKHSKKEILCLYASHAPFGGNVVGIEAASWRYFGRTPDDLSLAEYAMLAVLPNSPGMIHTGKNREILKSKRDGLLFKLYQKKHISKTEYELSILEEIPVNPKPYPIYAYHLLHRIRNELSKEELQGKIRTYIDLDLQKKLNKIADNYNEKYKTNNINNIAILVLDINSNEVIAYIGNANFLSNTEAKDVDMIIARRSTGSILKPILYTAMLSEGLILPSSLLPDTPTRISGFMPENFDKKYDGAVMADEALTRSLNIPFVRLLQSYGIGKFIHILQSAGYKGINKSSEHYGLSLILGGAEASLWEVCNSYASMAQSLAYYNSHNSLYSTNVWNRAKIVKSEDNSKHFKNRIKPTDFLSAGAIWHCFKTLTGVQRPEQESRWQFFSSRQKIAWKTGTSFGYKDAWTIGLSPDYVVGVWVGNATGEPKPGIIGIRLAAPVFFDVINTLPKYKIWFEMPYDDMEIAAVCKISGQLAGEYCHEKDSIYIPKAGINSEMCQYHKLIHLDETGKYRVNADCYQRDKMLEVSYFVLPPIMEYYYILKNPQYKKIPDLYESCSEISENKSSAIMDVVYPNNLAKIILPVEISGDTLGVIFRVKHSNPNAIIYWHIDQDYYTSTINFHETSIKLPIGDYNLKLIDNNGNSILRNFSIIESHR